MSSPKTERNTNTSDLSTLTKQSAEIIDLSTDKYYAIGVRNHSLATLRSCIGEEKLEELDVFANGKPIMSFMYSRDEGVNDVMLVLSDRIPTLLLQDSQGPRTLGYCGCVAWNEIDLSANPRDKEQILDTLEGIYAITIDFATTRAAQERALDLKALDNETTDPPTVDEVFAEVQEALGYTES